MSNSDDSIDQQDQMEYYCVPRKFVFDVPDDNNQKEDPAKRALKKSLEAEKYMPFIFSFPEPVNYKESYSLLIKQIVGVYNHIRLLIVEEYYEELKHIIQEIKIEQPGDCLTMLKELLTGCCEKIQTNTGEGREIGESDSVKGHEELLQKAEAKIRVLIRNEQIFRLNFDILTQKCEDADKMVQTVTQELEASKKIRETMTKENLELVSKLKAKDEEIRKANKERDQVEKRLKEAAAGLNALDNLEQAASGDPKNLAPSWNQQLLNMLVKEKCTPSETSSRPPSNFDGKGWAGVKQSSSRLTPTDRGKVEKKGNGTTNVNLVTNSSGNLNKGQVERLKSSLIADFKKHMNANLSLGTNRAVLNASLDVMLNKSTEQSHSQERNSVSGAMLSAKKRNSQQIKMGQSQDQIRMKPPMRDKKSVEANERETVSYLSNKNALQKIMTSANKHSNNSTRPTSTGKSRGSPLMSKSRIVQTEQSPDNRSQESKILYTYASNQSTDMAATSYSGNAKKKSAEPRDGKSQAKGSAKSSLLIKNMIAEQLNKKLGNKAG